MHLCNDIALNISKPKTACIANEFSAERLDEKSDSFYQLAEKLSFILLQTSVDFE